MNQLISELRRRNVFRVAAAYLVAGWIVMQVVGTIGSAAGLPGWADSLALVLLVTAFPIVLFIAWAFELTPDGMKTTAPSEGQEGFRPLDPSDYVLIAGVVVVLGAVIFQMVGSSDGQAAGPSNTPGRPNALSDNRTISDNSIAVLPFADLSPEGDQEYFGDGIAEEILNVLARIDALNVASRTSSFAFKSQSEMSIRDIALSLGVRHVLEGSVRTSGDAIRITAQLIDAETDRHLWSETFDMRRDAANIFAIQDEIAATIITELTRELNLDIDTAPVSTAAGGTSEVTAYEAFLEGRTLFINRNYENLPLAIERLEYAVAADPDYARAWAQLSVALAVAPGWSLTDRDYPTLARNAAERALALDPENSVALTALGQLTYTADDIDWASGVALMQRAIASDPNNATAHLWLGQMWRELGFFSRFEGSARSCLAVEPRYGVCIYDYANALLLQGREAEALAVLNGLMSTDHAESYPAFLGFVAQSDQDLLLGMMLREAADFLPASGGRWIVSDLSRALSDEDYDRDAARERFEARLRDSGFEPGTDAYFDMTYRLAFRAYGAIDTRQTPGWWWFSGYPGLRHSDAAKAAIIAVNVDDYWRAHGFPPQCRPVGDYDFECWFEDGT